MVREHIEFVTGKLAEPSLRRVVEDLSSRLGWDYSVAVLPITVAALMTPEWIARRWRPDPRAVRAVLPGYCEGDLSSLESRAGIPIERGPRDLRRLPEYFGQAQRNDFGSYSIEVLAEINHAPRLSLIEIREQARRLKDDGADIIDVGCDPGGGWTSVEECVRALRDDGHRVSIDSLDVQEIASGVRGGAELVLSVNSSNREAAADWGCEVVVIPDAIESMGGLAETIQFLEKKQVPIRIDPILEPIGCGFAQSIGRYLAVRQRWPAAQMLMGIGNLTELTEADSAAINLLLLGICEELQINRVLTTQVISWARSSVRECAIARSIVHYSIRERTPPKHLDSSLVMLRDPQVESYSDQQLDELASQIRDHNYRVFAEGGELHLVSAQMHLRDSDPFLLFQKLLAQSPANADPGHAFYLGFEMAKAAIALTLGKNYRQDESLDWGFLTVAESHHRLASSRKIANDREPDKE